LLRPDRCCRRRWSGCNPLARSGVGRRWRCSPASCRWRRCRARRCCCWRETTISV